MKKFLVTLASAGFLSTSALSGLVNINQTNVSTLSDNYATIFDWTDVKIDHTVEAYKLLGTDIKDGINVDTLTTNQSWDSTFKEARVLIASGNFVLQTSINPIVTSNVLLYLNEDKSNDLVKVWDFDQINDQRAGLIGLGQHLSQIRITVTAQYNQANGTTLLTVESYIYAKTFLALDSCSTTSQIENITFLSN